jgi:hypothetical protein
MVSVKPQEIRLGERIRVVACRETVGNERRLLSKNVGFFRGWRLKSFAYRYNSEERREA